jgi:integrase
VPTASAELAQIRTDAIEHPAGLFQCLREFIFVGWKPSRPTLNGPMTVIGAVLSDVTHTRKTNTRRRSARTPKGALPYSAIERALATYGASLADLRAKALVTVAFSTLLRRSELVALEVTDFKPTPDAADGTVRVRSSKADQAGHGAERYVSAEARRLGAASGPRAAARGYPAGGRRFDGLNGGASFPRARR